MMKRVLITGGSGFLGARILQQGLGDAELCSLPRGFLAAAGEAEVTETIQKLQPAAIVHAALCRTPAIAHSTRRKPIVPT